MVENMTLLTKLQPKWYVLIGMVCSFAMVFIDQTAIPVALPAIQKDLNTTALMLDWIINAYLLSLAALTILGGNLGDIYGHKKLFLIGLVLFATSSAMIGFAPAAKWVVIGRGIQGIGGALMVPSMTVIVTTRFSQNERGRAMGIMVGSAAIFASLGPLLGGFLTEYFSWRAVFWINIPFALLSFCIGVKMVPAKLHEHPGQPLDWAGAITLLISLFLLIFSVMEAPNYGWHSPLILGGVVIGLLCLLLFIRIELRQPYPMVELSLFKYKQIAFPVYILMLVQAAFIANVFWAIYFQDILNVSPAQAGVMMLPSIIPIIFFPTIGGYLRDKYGAKLPSVIGASMITIGMLWMTIFVHKESYFILVPGMLLAGCGAPFVFPAAMTMAMHSVEIHQRGLVTGICGAARQIGSSVGMAVLGSLIVYLNRLQLTHYLQEAGSPVNTLQVPQLEGLLSGASQARSAVSSLSASTVRQLFDTVKFAHVFSFNVMMCIVTLLCICVLLLAMRLPVKYDIKE